MDKCCDKKDNVCFEEGNNVIKLEEGIFGELYYSCSYCEVPDVFDTKLGVKKHHDICIQNIENKSCATCKHLEVVKNPPLEHLAKDKKDIQLRVWLGSYIEGYCGKKKKKLYESDFFKKYKCWEQFIEGEDVKKHYTKEYEEHAEKVKGVLEEIPTGEDGKVVT